MADLKVYVFNDSGSKSFADDIKADLSKRGYAPLTNEAFRNSPFVEIFDTADVIIVIYSSSLDDQRELNKIRKHANQYEKPLLEVEVYKNNDAPKLWIHHKAVRGGCANYSANAEDVHIQSEIIADNLDDFTAEKAREQRETEASRIENGINTHIKSILDNLKKRERRNKALSVVLYILSASVLFLTVLAAVLFIYKNDIVQMEIEKLITIGVVYIILAILTISISKFLFILAKAFMVESIRSSDRIHAISFGKFYVEVYDEQVTREELIKVLAATWNIDNGATSFRDQSSDEYDPKALEKILDLANFAKKS